MALNLLHLFTFYLTLFRGNDSRGSFYAGKFPFAVGKVVIIISAA
jgi:hypothetical protein